MSLVCCNDALGMPPLHVFDAAAACKAGAECWLFGSAAASLLGLGWYAVVMLMMQLCVVGDLTTRLWLSVVLPWGYGCWQCYNRFVVGSSTMGLWLLVVLQPGCG
jgi:hypothetical protein